MSLAMSRVSSEWVFGVRMRCGIRCVSSARASFRRHRSRWRGQSANSQRGCRLGAVAGMPRLRWGAARFHQRGPPPMPDEILQFRFQNLHKFVKVARQNLDRNNWDYLIGGSESETTLARNRLALDSLGFRPRVLRDV